MQGFKGPQWPDRVRQMSPFGAWRRRNSATQQAGSSSEAFHEAKTPNRPPEARIVLASPNWGVGCGGKSHPYSEQFRPTFETRRPLYGRLNVR
jgi:hypothetical protein